MSGFPGAVAIATSDDGDQGTEGEEEDAEWCRDVQKRFLEDHLVRWVPGFCDKVEDQASSSFYREMASLTKAFLQFEQTALERATDDVRGARQ